MTCQNNLPKLSVTTSAKILVYLSVSSIILYLVVINGIKSGRNSAYINDLVSSKSYDELFKISEFIRTRNSEQIIYNLHLYGPITPSTSVIVIQTHTRLQHVSALIESLSNLHGVNDTLLIFSHDEIVPSINKKIGDIKVARVMQIFYPYSLQLHPNRFPGPDPNDTLYYGMDWIPSLSQIKLHWWWKLNFVFERVKVLKDFNGVISFTEEDTYFVPNALSKLKVMEEAMKNNMCEGCDALAMGENDGYGTMSVKNGRGFLPDNLEGLIYTRLPSLHMAFNRTVWRKLKNCGQTFCEYNDYNWDFSLTHAMASEFCIEEPLKFFILNFPRVFHTGGCGAHFRDGDCDPTYYVTEAKQISENYGSQVPNKTLGELRIINVWRKMLKPKTENGGWRNPIVIKLCMNILEGKV